MERVVAIVLAAGRGTRMHGSVAKVLEPIAGEPMLLHVLDAVRDAGFAAACVVVGHEGSSVASAARVWGVARRFPVRISFQKRQLGSGHAAQQAHAAVRGARHVAVLAGDAPLVTPTTLAELIDVHLSENAAVTLLASELPDPTGYGRVVLDSQGVPKRVVEEPDAAPDVKRIRLVNTGAYCFRTDALFKALKRVKKENAKGEFYLTDVVGILAGDGERLALARCSEPTEALGVNDPAQLAAASLVIRKRVLARWMKEGVRVDDPETTYVDSTATLSPPLRLRPQSYVLGRSRLESGCDLGPGAYVEDSRIGAGSRVLYSTLRSADVGRSVWVGPYAHLRPGTRVSDGCKIGNFVEIKNSRLGKNVSAGHLAYLGDATIEDGVNIGAGAITANFDGKQKHPTHIGAGSKVGSNTVLVAPLRIGRNVTTGAGAVVKAGTKAPDGSVLVGVPARVIQKKKKNTA